MALAGLGSWNLFSPQFFTGAMEAGARTGLSAREQDIQSEEAADRLKLAYEQLGQKERLASRQMEAAAALKAQSLAAQTQYRADMLKDAASRLTETHRHNLMLEGGKTDKDIQPKEISIGGKSYIYNPATGSFKSPTVEKQPTVTAALNPNDPFGPKVTGPISDPFINKLLGTNAPSALLDSQTKKLTKDQAKAFLGQAKGDKKKARQLARDAGYEF